MDQLIIIILIGLISLINWLVQKSAEMREKRKAERAAQDHGVHELRQHPQPVQEDAFVPPSPEEIEEEKLRRFMEALGLEPDEKPSRPIPVPQPEPVHQFRPPLPPAPLPEEVIPPVPVLVEAETPAPSVRASRRKKEPVEEQTEPSGVRRLLANPRGLRDAIILSEILGPPRALQDSGNS